MLHCARFSFVRCERVQLYFESRTRGTGQLWLDTVDTITHKRLERSRVSRRILHSLDARRAHRAIQKLTQSQQNMTTTEAEKEVRPPY